MIEEIPRPGPGVVRDIFGGGWETIDPHTKIEWDEEPDNPSDPGCADRLSSLRTKMQWQCTRASNHPGWHVAGVGFGIAVASWPPKEA